MKCLHRQYKEKRTEACRKAMNKDEELRVGVEGVEAEELDAEAGADAEAEVGSDAGRRRLQDTSYTAIRRRRSCRLGNAFYCWCLPMPCFA